MSTISATKRPEMPALRPLLTAVTLNEVTRYVSVIAPGRHRSSG
jgi:hypothetical protein